jgi:hypothetical protein
VSFDDVLVENEGVTTLEVCGNVVSAFEGRYVLSFGFSERRVDDTPARTTRTGRNSYSREN